MDLIKIVALFLSVSVVVLAQKTPEQVHLSFPKHGEMTVTWITQHNTNTSKVQYGLQSGLYIYNTTGHYRTMITPQFRTFYIHEATLSNLKANTRYYYMCGDDNAGYSPEYYFNTIDPKAQEVHYAVYGDMGLVNARSFPLIKKQVQQGLFDMILHVGDMAYNMDERDSKQGDDFMRMIEPVSAFLPYQTCPGNHESDIAMTFQNYKQRFTMPGDEQNMFYSFDVGLIHFVAFSTEHYFWPTETPWLWTQYDWLINDLKKANQNRAQRPWIVMFGHRPLYCSNNDSDHDCYDDTATVREGLNILGKRYCGIDDVLYNYGVDLYIGAHEHSYERCYPVYKGNVYNGTLYEPYTNPKATVHIISGSAGCRENLDSFGDAGFGPWSAKRIAAYGFGHMTVYNSTHLSFTQINGETGDVLDTFTLIQKNHGPFQSKF